MRSRPRGPGEHRRGHGRHAPATINAQPPLIMILANTMPFAGSCRAVAHFFSVFLVCSLGDRNMFSCTCSLESEPRHQTCLAPSLARLLQPHRHQHTFNFIMCGAPPPSCSIWASPSLCASAPPPTIEFTRISTSELAPCITIPDL